MPTVNQTIEALQAMVESAPRVGDLSIIYSKDDEGNGFQSIHNTPSLTQVENMEERDLEVIGYYTGGDDADVPESECNCVIIN